MGHSRKSQLFVVSLILYSILTATAVWGQSTPSQAGFISIDCGATKSYTDPLTGLNWVPDTNYTSLGENIANVPGSNSFSSNHPYASTLRNFPKPQPKYCYELPGTTPNATYLIRHSYWFGSFDGNPTAPTFLVGLDSGKGSLTINVTGIILPLQFEVIYKARGNSISFCLYRDGTNSTPFISALELRPINPAAYVNPILDDGGCLYSILRLNLATIAGQNTRFPDDKYDRIWLGWMDSPGVLSTTSLVDPNALALAPPSKVMQSAQTTGLLGPISFVATFLSVLSSFKVTLHLYFAEIAATSSATSRSFTINLAGFPPEPCNPYVDGGGPLKSSVKTFYNWTLEKTGITMVPTDTSVDPPLLNAIEIFYSIPMEKNTTNASDVSAIDEIKRAFGLTLSSAGDPCLPAPYSWIACSVGNSPRVTSITLSYYNLTGEIPAALGSLTALRFLSLDHNALTGPIPDLSRLTSLEIAHFDNNALNGTIPDTIGSSTLKELYLQENRFVGKVPDNLKRPSLKLVVSGNPGLNDSSVYTGPTASPSGLDPVGPSSSGGKKDNAALIGGVVGGVVATLLIITCLGFFIWRYRMNRTSPGSDNRPSGDAIGTGLVPGAQRYTLAEMKTATNDFTNKIGKGGFGPVYYGKLSNGAEVAIKDRDENSKQGSNEFENEVELLSRIHHRNLVSLLGYCEEDNRQMLVYEFVHRGTLQEHLYGPDMNSKEPLDWKRRLNIALHAAIGLEYLHNGCSPNIIHRDIKSCNILLTSNYTAKVADFGLSKMLGEAASHVATMVKGTIGYLDPEYTSTHVLTEKSDVYSFGVVMLEILCARKPIDPSFANENERNLVHWARICLQAGDVEKMLDPALLRYAPDLNAVWRVAETAIMCVEPKGKFRPTMQDVVRELREAIEYSSGSSTISATRRRSAYDSRYGSTGRTFSTSMSPNSGISVPSTYDSDNSIMRPAIR